MKGRRWNPIRRFRRTTALPESESETLSQMSQTTDTSQSLSLEGFHETVARLLGYNEQWSNGDVERGIKENTKRKEAEEASVQVERRPSLFSRFQCGFDLRELLENGGEKLLFEKLLCGACGVYPQPTQPASDPRSYVVNENAVKRFLCDLERMSSLEKMLGCPHPSQMKSTVMEQVDPHEQYGGQRSSRRMNERELAQAGSILLARRGASRTKSPEGYGDEYPIEKRFYSASDPGTRLQARQRRRVSSADLDLALEKSRTAESLVIRSESDTALKHKRPVLFPKSIKRSFSRIAVGRRLNRSTPTRKSTSSSKDNSIVANATDPDYSEPFPTEDELFPVTPKGFFRVLENRRLRRAVSAGQMAAARTDDSVTRAESPNADQMITFPIRVIEAGKSMPVGPPQTNVFMNEQHPNFFKETSTPTFDNRPDTGKEDEQYLLKEHKESPVGARSDGFLSASSGYTESYSKRPAQRLPREPMESPFTSAGEYTSSERRGLMSEGYKESAFTPTRGYMSRDYKKPPLASRGGSPRKPDDFDSRHKYTLVSNGTRGGARIIEQAAEYTLKEYEASTSASSTASTNTTDSDSRFGFDQSTRRKFSVSDQDYEEYTLEDYGEVNDSHASRAGTNTTCSSAVSTEDRSISAKMDKLRGSTDQPLYLYRNSSEKSSYSTNGHLAVFKMAENMKDSLNDSLDALGDINL